MGGRNGFTLDDYGRYSDRQIISLLRVSWDEDGKLICEGEEEPDGTRETGSIRNAGRELQAPEQLGVSEEELQEAMSIRPFVSVFYFSMFLSVWMKRGLTKDEALRKWREHLASNN
jgi:hypothetical protein